MNYIISRKHKFVCNLIPKCATRALLRYFVDENDYKAKGVNRDWFTWGYFRFAFIRNPLARVVSLYLSKVKKDECSFNDYGLYSYMPFEDFVRVICSQDDNTADKHWRSQHTFLNGVDFIGTVENMDEDFNTVCGLIGIDNKGLQRYHYTTDDGAHFKTTNSSKFVNFMSYYNSETLELVLDRYEKDLILYDENR